ncbi:MAG: NAD-dependent epimerase/dehydratase family protein [Planctomycetota bacterium]|nr:NAD-dependent epimerase/dehydratase family protein [Planctomycetota bacterium]
MRRSVILITGANGEIGHGLVNHFGRTSDHAILALDLKPLDDSLKCSGVDSIVGDILDDDLIQRIVSEYEINAIYHLAALLSTRAEYTPDIAHRVNVEGTLNLLKLAHEQSRWQEREVKFLFPSSIAVYGLPDRATKDRAGRLREEEWNLPTTMYGCNKLYCEQLGRYYALHHRQLAADRTPGGIDFRAVRFPGLISAETMPAGGTSDFAAEMVHAAARGEPYDCFVDEDARLPFLVMPDAIKAMTTIAAAPKENLTQSVYNVGAFSLSAGEIRDRVLGAFPDARVSFAPDRPRNCIVNSWPADIDDSRARREWNWSPDYDVDKAFGEYLAPGVRNGLRNP